MSDEAIRLAHGGGGRLMDELLRTHVFPQLGMADGPLLDSAVFSQGADRLAFTTDSYVVKPLEFPGGNIGDLAVCGTVNDLAMTGARPVALSLALIIEEGLQQSQLARIITSVRRAADEAQVRIVTGDTKVVEHGSADGMYITTSGVGVVLEQARLGFERISPGDVVLVSGTVGDHGLAVMSQREDLAFASSLTSDVASVSHLANAMVAELSSAVKFLRDPTRSGLAGVLVDVAETTGLTVVIEEASVPVNPTAAAAAEMLGLDILTVANEGKFVAVVSPEAAQRALALCRSHAVGKAASIIGTIASEGNGQVILRTAAGGQRIIPKPYGQQLPRIC